MRSRVKRARILLWFLFTPFFRHSSSRFEILLLFSLHSFSYPSSPFCLDHTTSSDHITFSSLPSRYLFSPCHPLLTPILFPHHSLSIQNKANSSLFYSPTGTPSPPSSTTKTPLSPAPAGTRSAARRSPALLPLPPPPPLLPRRLVQRKALPLPPRRARKPLLSLKTTMRMPLRL